MLLSATCLALALLAGDTVGAPAPAGVPPAPGRVPSLARLTPPPLPPALLPSLAADTAERPEAVEYSDAYFTRLTIHRYASYAMLPLFAAQYAAGDQLMRKSADAPAWARASHGLLATGVAGLFAVNTVTGGWNLWEARKDPEGRTRRTVHGALMLLADAGFTATGLLADRAENSGDVRALHRTLALGSMGVSLFSMAIMLPVFGNR